MYLVNVIDFTIKYILKLKIRTAENSALGTTLINIGLCKEVQIWTRVQKYIGEFLISNIAPAGIDPDVKSVPIVEQRIG